MSEQPGQQYGPPPGQQYGPPAPGYGQSGQQQGQYGQQQGQQYGPPPGQAGYGYGPRPEMSPSDQRLWGMLAHLSAIVASFVGLTFLGPLVVYLVLKDRGVFVRRQSAEALNFQILVNVVMLAGVVITFLTLGIGVIVVGPVLAVLGVVALVFVIIAAVQANQGVDYRYPVNWRLVH